MKKIRATEAFRGGVQHWLRQVLAPHKPLLNAALILAYLAALLLVWQSWLLALLFADWLVVWQQHGAVALDVTLLRDLLPWLLLCLLLRPLLQYGRERLCQQASLRARSGLRDQLLAQLAALGPGRQALGADAVLGSRLLEQVDALDGYISRYHVQRYLVVLVPLTLLLCIFYYSPLAGILMLVTAPLVPLFMVLLGKAAAAASQKQFVALARMSGRFMDLLRGLKTLQHLQAVPQAEAEVARAAEHYRAGTMGVLRIAFLSGAVLEFFSALAIALVALYLGLGLLGILPWAKGSIPVPYQGALFILLLAPEFYNPLRQLGSDYHAKAEAEAALSELMPLLELQVWQHPGQQPLQLSAAPSLAFHQLDIAQRLAPFNLQLAAGERVVLQGASGSGKSSLLQAVLGFLPYGGEIRINQQSLLTLRRADWHQQLGFLSQQPQLLHGNLADNLRLAAPEASDAQLVAVLDQVALWPLIRQLPLQLQTPLGERGLGLSGGQLSRLALAQLLLRDTPVWLLDEPTAHLDPQTAAHINALLERLSQGRTVLLVSHELAGLEWVDRVVSLDAPSVTQVTA
ncbi:MAG: thiol reductant ABC exporter subunit CydD [Halopseudomonas sp.]|uniref:thiol reductant ABC exporter subunit CydD n=1 Tax=Halopseudomonas sp. TaxID=2901191 RepID=UPI003002A2B1